MLSIMLFKKIAFVSSVALLTNLIFSPLHAEDCKSLCMQLDSIEKMYDQYDFILQGFLVRYFNISISPYQQYRYYLKEKDINSEVPNIYRKVDMGLINYDLFVQDSVPR